MILFFLLNPGGVIITAGFTHVIIDIKNLLDKNKIEMPSQVTEHKMYRDNRFDLRKSE